MERQDIAIPECQGPKDTDCRLHTSQGYSEVLLDRMQGTTYQSILHISEHAKAVLMGVQGVVTLFGFLENIRVSLVRFKVGTVLRRFGQDRDDAVEFRFCDEDVILGTAGILDLGTTDAFVVDGTDGLPVDADRRFIP